MRSQTYGDKQREAQQRKKKEELWKKSHPEVTPASDDPGKTDESNQERKRTTKKIRPAGEPHSAAN